MHANIEFQKCKFFRFDSSCSYWPSLEPISFCHIKSSPMHIYLLCSVYIRSVCAETAQRRWSCLQENGVTCYLMLLFVDSCDIQKITPKRTKIKPSIRYVPHHQTVIIIVNLPWLVCIVENIKHMWQRISKSTFSMCKPILIESIRNYTPHSIVTMVKKNIDKTIWDLLWHFVTFRTL